MKITLKNEQGMQLAELDVDPEKIARAAILIWEGRHFVYAGFDNRRARYFTNVIFTEVQPPVTIP